MVLGVTRNAAVATLVLRKRRRGQGSRLGVFG
jgi:hypothetical protein